MIGEQLKMSTELKKLFELDYKTESHTFSKGVIAAYYNLLEYPGRVEKDWIQVKRRKGNVYFLLRPDIIPTGETLSMKKDIFYSQVRTRSTPVKTKEVVYDLEELFNNKKCTNSSDVLKQLRRGVTLGDRKDISIINSTSLEVEDLYNEWSEHKMNDPKVFRIAFTPKRYLRSFQLKEKGFKIFEQEIFVKNKLYGAICYEVQGDIAFELAFISRYWDKELKLINDQNECILINSFYELYQKGVKKINVGTSAGIKGLKLFKNKLPNYEHFIYSN